VICWRCLYGNLNLFLLAICVTYTSTAHSTISFDILNKARPRAVDLLGQEPEESRFTLTNTQKSIQQDEAELERKLAALLNANDCETIVNSVSRHDYENVKPEVLALVAYCEPAGKDPIKMFAFAEQRASDSDPDKDIIFLLHARYLWKHKNPAAEELFQKIYDRTKDPRLKELVAQYLVDKTPPRRRGVDDFTFIVSGQLGGIQEANPQGIPLSDHNFGSNNSSAAVAQIIGNVRKPLSSYAIGADFITTDTTFWATHSADFSTDDLDVYFEKRLESGRTLALRPFTSLYLFQGGHYYSLLGIGLMTSQRSADFESWMQLSTYNDTYQGGQVSAESGGHLRFDWQGALKKVPLLAPTILAYVDYARCGVALANSEYIPYTHAEYGLAVSFTKVVRRYSVGLTMRGVYREDAEQTRVVDPNGNYVSKLRRDVQVVLQPHITIPLMDGVDLFMYFESNSTSSTLGASDGLDRNISDNLIGAVIRVAVANF